MTAGGGLKFIDEFWKEPDRAVTTAVRSFSDGREIRLEEPTGRLAGMKWGEIKKWLGEHLDEKMTAEGIDAKPHSSWSARTTTRKV